MCVFVRLFRAEGRQEILPLLLNNCHPSRHSLLTYLLSKQQTYEYTNKLPTLKTSHQHLSVCLSACLC